LGVHEIGIVAAVLDAGTVTEVGGFGAGGVVTVTLVLTTYGLHPWRLHAANSK
jgi:hypothetical protein